MVLNFSLCCKVHGNYLILWSSHFLFSHHSQHIYYFDSNLCLSPVMDSPTDLFDDSVPRMHAFTPTHSSSDSPGVHPQPGTGHPPPPAFRPPGFPLIHHLLQPGSASRRMGGHVNVNLSARRLLEDKNLEEGNRDGQMDQRLEGEEDALMEGEEDLLGARKRHSDPVLGGKWSRDIRKVKRMKLDMQPEDGELDQGGKKREALGRKGGRRKEREQLKEQLEEARERLKALQERVWRAFGEKHMEEEKDSHIDRGQEDGGDIGMVEEEDETGGAFDEDDIDGGEMEKENFSLLSVSPFSSIQKRKEGPQKEKEGRRERGRGGGGGLHLEGMMDGASLWLECGGLMRDDCYGMEEEGEEGGQKFAQALKLELGSAVARVIDRVLRLYTEMADAAPSPPAGTVSFLPAEPENDSGGEKDVWMGLLAMGREEDKARGKGEKAGGAEEDREKQLLKMSNGSAPPTGQPRRTDPSDLPLPLAVQRSADMRKAHPLLGPPLSASLTPSHPNLPLHPQSLPRPPPLSHPPLLPPASQQKDHLSTSSSLHPPSSSSSSSYPPPPPPPPPPLPLPLLHYSMQQLFSRSLHHPQLPHLPPSRKDYLSSDPFLDFSSHPSFPPLPLLGHLDPTLARHPHGRERERGMRGEGGMRGAMDGGELYLTAGGISFSQ